MRPAAQFLSLTRQRKKPKKGDPTSATPALRSGANLRRASDGVGRRTHFALFERSVQTAAASQFTKRLHPSVQSPPRQNHAAGAASRGVEQPHGPSLRSAPNGAGPSAAMARLVFPPLWTCREAQSGRWARAPKDARASCSDSLQLFERSANGAQRVLQRHRSIEHRRLPHRNAMGTRPVGSPSFAFFSWRVKKRRCAAGRISRPPSFDQATTPNERATNESLQIQ